jgi:hypothetical protein
VIIIIDISIIDIMIPAIILSIDIIVVLFVQYCVMMMIVVDDCCCCY